METRRQKDPKLSIGGGFAVFPNPNPNTEPMPFLAYISRKRATLDGNVKMNTPSGTGTLIGPGVPGFVGTADEILAFMKELAVPRDELLASFRYDRKGHLVLLQVGAESYIVAKTTLPAPGYKWVQNLLTQIGRTIGVPKNEMAGMFSKRRPGPRRSETQGPSQPAPVEPPAQIEESEKEPSRFEKLLASDVGKTLIEELTLSKKTKNLLFSAGIQTVGDAFAHHARDEGGLSSIDKFGDKSLEEFKAALESLGLELPEPVEK